MKPPATASWRADFLINAIAVAVASLGLLVLIGWFLHIEVLVACGRHGIAMRFNTAMCLVIAAVGLWCGLREERKFCAQVTRLCGMILTVVGGLTLLERMYGWNLHIDQLLWTDTISTSHPGEMAAISAASFLLIGSCIWMRAGGGLLPAASQWLTLATALVAQWAVLDVLLRTNEGTGVAVHTAFALLAICFALLILPAHGGILAVLARSSSGGRLLRRLLPVAMLVPLLLGCFRWYLVQQTWIDSQAGLAIMVTTLTASVLLTTIWSANSIDRIERQRQQLEDELTGFFNLPLHSLLAIIGFDGRFKRISSSWSQILGYNQEHILTMPYMDLVDPADREATRQCAARIAGGEEAIEFENRYVTKDGKTRWLKWNAIPAGNDVMYAIAEDITRRKEAEIQLQQSEERLRLLIEGMKGHAVYMLDPDGRIMSWNSGAQQLTGYAAAEVIGRPVAMLYPAANAGEPTMGDLLAQAAANGHLEQQGVKLRKDGSRFLVEAYIAALRDEEGKLLGFAKISRDITERARAEQDIRELNEQLERKVEERTAELAASNKELEAFAYSVSHDLRAPLRHLDGFLSLLQKRVYRELDELSRHYIDNTTMASRRMGTLIDELLQFSRLGRSQLRRTQVDLADVVEKTRLELEPESDGRTVRWNIAALPRLVADPAMVRQVMQNLLSNALKFTRTRAQADISIGARIAPDGAQTVWVRDNGVGFDMQYYGKLFEVFQRLHGESEFEGTGIGLANVRRIVERHGGRVWAEGELDKGATFYFSLPPEAGEAGKEIDEPIEAYSASGR